MTPLEPMIGIMPEMGIAPSVAGTGWFMGKERILESVPPGEFFAARKDAKSLSFLFQIRY